MLLLCAVEKLDLHSSRIPQLKSIVKYLAWRKVRYSETGAGIIHFNGVQFRIARIRNRHLHIRRAAARYQYNRGCGDHQQKETPPSPEEKHSFSVDAADEKKSLTTGVILNERSKVKDPEKASRMKFTRLPNSSCETSSPSPAGGCTRQHSAAINGCRWPEFR